MRTPTTKPLTLNLNPIVIPELTSTTRAVREKHELTSTLQPSGTPSASPSATHSMYRTGSGARVWGCCQPLLQAPPNPNPNTHRFRNPRPLQVTWAKGPLRWLPPPSSPAKQGWAQGLGLRLPLRPPDPRDAPRGPRSPGREGVDDVPREVLPRLGGRAALGCIAQELQGKGRGQG